jgi:hypothetical protein
MAMRPLGRNVSTILEKKYNCLLYGSRTPIVKQINTAHLLGEPGAF